MHTSSRRHREIIFVREKWKVSSRFGVVWEEVDEVRRVKMEGRGVRAKGAAN